MKKLIFLFCMIAALAAHLQPHRAPAAAQPPRSLTDTLVIPFEHKQSAIFHRYTLDVLDSVVRILNANKEITLSIEGYAYIDEGNDTICKYLSLDRALFVRDAMLGRGIDSSRIKNVSGLGQWKPEKRGHYKVNSSVHCRAELLLIYPPPPVPIVVSDRDGDGIPDANDGCPDAYGYPEENGCPRKDVYYVMFAAGGSYLSNEGFGMSDKILNVLRANPKYTVIIGGHASKDECAASLAEKLSSDRADMISRYLLSRNIPASRIEVLKGYGRSRPVSGQRDPYEIYENQCAEITFNKHE